MTWRMHTETEASETKSKSEYHASKKADIYNIMFYTATPSQKITVSV